MMPLRSSKRSSHCSQHFLCDAPNDASTTTTTTQHPLAFTAEMTSPMHTKRRRGKTKIDNRNDYYSNVDNNIQNSKSFYHEHLANFSHSPLTTTTTTTPKTMQLLQTKQQQKQQRSRLTTTTMIIITLAFLILLGLLSLLSTTTTTNQPSVRTTTIITFTSSLFSTTITTITTVNNYINRIPLLPFITLVHAQETTSQSSGDERLFNNDSEIVFGQSCDLYGALNRLCIDFNKGVAGALNQINKYGVWGNGKTIRVESLDDEYNPDLTLNNTRHFLERDDVFGLFGYLGSPTIAVCVCSVLFVVVAFVSNICLFTPIFCD